MARARLLAVCPEVKYALATSTRFVPLFELRTFLNTFLSVIATLADPNGACGENRRGIGNVSTSILRLRRRKTSTGVTDGMSLPTNADRGVA